MGVKELLPIFNQFKEDIKKNPTNAKALLVQLKKEFVNFKTFLPTRSITDLDEEGKYEIMLVRETLEYAILLATQTRDLEEFERQVNQVKTYYAHNFNGVEKSAREPLILGLNLLRLLAQNRIAEFHTELELIPIEQLSNMYIKHPIDLELHLMEGSYNKLRILRQQVPADEYIVFMDIMMETMREEIADCCEKAYHSLTLPAIQKLLMFQNADETMQFISKRGWHVVDGTITFAKEKEQVTPFEETSKAMIKKTLDYANEMSRII